jgi:hypothetical protein
VRLVLATLAAFVVAAPASASYGVPNATLPATSVMLYGAGARTAHYQRYADASLVPTVPGRVRLVLEPCPGGTSDIVACTTWDGRTIYLNERSIAEPTRHVILLHELGHVLDFRHLTSDDRRTFRRLLGIRRLWGDWAGRKPPPRELFGDAYAACALGLDHDDLRYYWGYGYLYPLPVRHREVCDLISRIGLRAYGWQFR